MVVVVAVAAAVAPELADPRMRKVVITGGPGAGKTTLLQALQARGHATRGDSARDVIRQRLALGLAPRPEPEDFARQVLALDMANFMVTPETAGSHQTVFFERGVVDALAMLHEAVSLSTAQRREALTLHPYHPQVFVLPPWREIYVNDAERDHSFEHAERVCGEVRTWYERCGYAVTEVPKATVAERVRFVLCALGDASA